MAKYIIDIPEELAKASEEYWEKSTGMVLVPYTEPSQKAIDLQHAHDIENVARMNYSKGAEDAWDFVFKFEGESEKINECFGMDRLLDVMSSMTYSEAKAKYEEWLKQKDEIRVGDEIKQITANGSPTGLKCTVIEIDGDKMHGIGEDGNIVVCSFQVKRWWRKTGRHFDEVTELLKKMKGE